MILYLVLLATTASAQGQKTNLYRKEKAAEVVVDAPMQPVQSKLRNQAQPTLANGNLPAFYLGRNASSRIGQGSPVVLPTKQVGRTHQHLKFGEMVEAEIPESVIAFPDSKVPIRAIVRHGRLKGTVFLGEATLERNSKRISIDFTKLRDSRQNESFAIRGAAYDASGSLGVKGKHYSGEAKYFGAEFLAAFAAGYSDALVERDVTPFGQVRNQPTVSNAGREGVANAMSRTADRFANKIKSAPEYVSAQGPVIIQILITE